MNIDWGKNPDVTLDDDVIQKKEESSQYVPNKNMFFAFVDVLGFQQTYEEHREDESSDFAKAYERVFGYFCRLMNNAKFIKDKPRNEWVAAAGQTSDSLYFYTDRIDFLAGFVKIYSHFILYAMSQNVFFRGGIGHGGLFINTPYQFYGDSVIKAFLMESTIAKLPRVAIDEKTRFELDPYLDEKFFKDEKGRHYIAPCINVKRKDILEYYDSDFVFEDIGADVIKCIEHNINFNHNKFEFVEGTYQKYDYLSTCFKQSDLLCSE